MKDQTDKPVPFAPSVIWTQVRTRVLPLVVFLLLSTLTYVLWTGTQTASVMGIAEGPRSILGSPVPALITEVKVAPYQLVNEGDPLIVLRSDDPRTQLDLLQTELRILETRYQPSISQRNAMDYQRIRVDTLRLKTELAVSRVQLERAENEVTRNSSLYKDKLLSEDLYDLSVKTRDALLAEVKEKSAALSDLDERLKELRSLGDPASSESNKAYDEVLARLEQTYAQAATNSGTIVLRAPFAGMVTPPTRGIGEHVSQGEHLIGVNAISSERVVAYLRQPYPVDPQVGMQVTVITRSSKRQHFSVSITQVGNQVENITNVLAYVRQGALVDVGLPIVLSLPPGNSLRPGEVVDLRIQPADPKAVNVN